MDVKFIEKVPDGGKRFDTVGDGDVVILPAFGASLEEMQLLDDKALHWRPAASAARRPSPYQHADLSAGLPDGPRSPPEAPPLLIPSWSPPPRRASQS